MKHSNKTTFDLLSTTADKRQTASAASLLLAGALVSAPAASFAGNIYVDASVQRDTMGCGRHDDPCASISWAVDAVASPGDNVHLVGNTDFIVTGVLVSKDLSIHGNGLTVLDARGLDRHFQIDNDASVSLFNMKLINGAVADNGGSIQVLEGNLRARNVRFENNQALGGGAVSIESGTLLSEGSDFIDNEATANNGGAISCNDYGQGSLEIIDTLFNENTALQDGGAISTSCDTNVRRNTFMKNTANFGGAIQATIVDSDLLELRRTQFSGNKADNAGGAIHMQGGKADIRRSSFYHNRANYGGAISYNGNQGNVDEFTVVNSTFSSNVATEEGGAVYTNTPGELHFTTLIDNRAESGTGLDILATNAFGIYNTLIDRIDSDPSDMICAGDYFNQGLMVGSGNLIGPGSCGQNVFVLGTHNYSTLKPLNYNGDLTLSHELGLQSVVHDTLLLDCNGPNGLNNIDQNGKPRPGSDGHCDIGAVQH